MDDKIYFLENIIPIYRDSVEKIDSYSVVLLRVFENNEVYNNELFNPFIVVEANKEEILDFHEGQFVYYNEDKIGTFLKNANNSKIAKRNFYINNLYRGMLKKYQMESNEEVSILTCSEIFSYHINVGHGNCSILAFMDNKSHLNLWMIDCSNREIKTGHWYSKNITDCFSYIKSKFHLKSIEINKFFLTHNHYDHYSGIVNLIDNGILTSNTDWFLNRYYSMPSPIFNQFLKKMDALKPRIYEPIITTKQSGIEIWHPEKRTERPNKSNLNNPNINKESDVNNSSCVYYFNLGGKSILFPGDIQKTGWDKIDQCAGFLKSSDYFMVSHHGSINGHLRNVCKLKSNIQNLSDCLKPKRKSVIGNGIPIIMGRDGAFRGIYSQEVINDFKSKSFDLIYSEKDNLGVTKQFLEIDWQTNYFNWI